ncbi:hypothetical protein ACJJIQ_09425 [Microbulbifer sp. ANSA003]|uniref:hypothetical protein n=1 Tax=Microbulbifer sp. ANSA003 TaxID=3243360 RepID=UPI004042A8A9
MLFGTTKKPKGPNLSKSKPVSCNLSGTKLNFVKPPSNRFIPGAVDSTPNLPLNFDFNIYSFKDFVKLSDNVWGLLLAEEYYKYCGTPLWNPEIGGMDFRAALRRPVGLPNLLEANNYELWIDSNIKAYYEPGTGLSFNEWYYLFPLFWQTFRLPKTGNIQWIAYVVQKFCARKGDQFTYYTRAAISSEHELILSFRATTDQYESGAFSLFKKIVRFILNNIEIKLTKSIEVEISELEESGLRNFSKEKPISRYDDTPKNPFGDYELLEDPYFYFTKIGKTIDRRLWVD